MGGTTTGGPQTESGRDVPKLLLTDAHHGAWAKPRKRSPRFQHEMWFFSPRVDS